MDDCPREPDEARPPVAVAASLDELSDDERAVAAAKAQRQVAATLRATWTE